MERLLLGLRVKAPTGPRYVWTDEPPDPTTFALMFAPAVAERQRRRAQYDQGQNRGRCSGQCSGRGNRGGRSPHGLTRKDVDHEDVHDD